MEAAGLHEGAATLRLVIHVFSTSLFISSSCGPLAPPVPYLMCMIGIQNDYDYKMIVYNFSRRHF